MNDHHKLSLTIFLRKIIIIDIILFFISHHFCSKSLNNEKISDPKKNVKHKDGIYVLENEN